jgi:hypothetical protein
MRHVGHQVPPVSEQMPLADVKNRVDDLESLQETLDPVALM